MIRRERWCIKAPPSCTLQSSHARRKLRHDMAIPKIIHQTVPDKNDMHPAFVENTHALQRLNRCWSYRLYDDVDIRAFIAQCYGSDTLRCRPSWCRIWRCVTSLSTSKSVR